ncbi:sucrase ferredoxin [Blastococcus goldschmidtiae]|uniref:Sucrase ferredoxin n=1 Tax=Blastococcus goldschmidtiae TaxID=3075546 RepID=A0ABU2KCE8_9ACTN|nr:sucrase ferredoxin [Blastococcus sp. DSM 46792]MDT0277850.1 sucrase ferredoxin [Blastococcus sp. DSM 46792]
MTPAAPPPADDFCRVEVPPRPAGRLDPTRCSVQALTRGDSGIATASPVQRWLLVEQPGPWGRDALSQSRFDPGVAPLLAERARQEDVRVLLVRRPGDRLADAGGRWAYADSRPGREGLWWSVRTSDADLLTAAWDGSVGEPTDRPTYLVCTHGGHDACCALRGRPLARAMPAPGPADVWECSHLGGDRFAANVVVLPHGFYYGQVPGDGALLVAAHERGQVALAWLRGRAGLPAHVQAAQHGAREELGLLGIDDLAPLGATRLPAAERDAERWEVTLAGPGGPVTVVVESRPSPEAVHLTCSAARPGRVRTWHRLSVSPAPGG